MKRYILSVCTIIALSGMLFTSCSDVDDVNDLELARVLSPTNLSAISSTLEPSITVSWTAMDNADEYVIEAYLEDPTFSSSPVVTATTSETTYVLADLVGESEYNIRVKGVAEGVEDSKWSTITRKTAAEQILSVPYSGIEETSIVVTWPSSKEVDQLDAILDGEVVNSYDVSSADGSFTATGLKGGKEYTFEIYLNGKRRGSIKQMTEIGKPESDYEITATGISSSNSIADMLKAVASQAATDGKTSYSVTVLIPAGETVEFYSIKTEDGSKDNVTLPDGMSVYFYGDKTNMPTIDFGAKLLNVAGTHETIAFQKVKLTGTGYLINQSAACNVTNLLFEICEASGFTGNTFVRTQGSNSPTIDNVSLKKCLIHNCTNNYSLLDFRKAVLKNVLIENSTIYNATSTGKSIFQTDNNITSLTISNTTFYNVCGNAQYFIDFGGTSYGADKFVIENVLLTKTADDNTGKIIRASSDPLVTNSYYTNDWYKAFTGLEIIDVDAATIFSDPENGDFTLKSDYTGYQTGDPRWY